MQGPGSFTQLTVTTVIGSPTTGLVEGIFLYAPNPGAPGNPPRAYLVPASINKDPFGNVVPGGAILGITSADNNNQVLISEGSINIRTGNGTNPELNPFVLQATGNSQDGRTAVLIAPGTLGNDRRGELDLHTVAFGTGLGDMNWNGRFVCFGVDIQSGGLAVAEGSNAKQGIATLAAGTVVVANTSVTATSRIHLTAQDNNTTGALRVSARTAGTSFTITSSNAADTGVVAWEMFEVG